MNATKTRQHLLSIATSTDWMPFWFEERAEHFPVGNIYCTVDLQMAICARLSGPHCYIFDVRQTKSGWHIWKVQGLLSRDRFSLILKKCQLLEGCINYFSPGYTTWQTSNTHISDWNGLTAGAHLECDWTEVLSFCAVFRWLKHSFPIQHLK